MGLSMHGVVQLARHERAYMNVRTYAAKVAGRTGRGSCDSDVTQRHHPLGQWEDLWLGAQRGRALVAPSTGPPAEDAASTIGTARRGDGHQRRHPVGPLRH